MMFMGVDVSYLIIDYLIAIFSSIIIALILRLPLLPEKPYRYSFEVSALYPTPIISIGVFSFFVILNYLFWYDGMVVALIIGVCSALFVKYLFFHVFPKPLAEESKEVLANE